MAVHPARLTNPLSNPQGPRLLAHLPPEIRQTFLDCLPDCETKVAFLNAFPYPSVKASVADLEKGACRRLVRAARLFQSAISPDIKLAEQALHLSLPEGGQIAVDLKAIRDARSLIANESLNLWRQVASKVIEMSPSERDKLLKYDFFPSEREDVELIVKLLDSIDTPTAREILKRPNLFSREDLWTVIELSERMGDETRPVTVASLIDALMEDETLSEDNFDILLRLAVTVHKYPGASNGLLLLARIAIKFLDEEGTREIEIVSFQEDPISALHRLIEYLFNKDHSALCKDLPLMVEITRLIPQRGMYRYYTMRSILKNLEIRTKGRLPAVHLLQNTVKNAPLKTAAQLHPCLSVLSIEALCKKGSFEDLSQMIEIASKIGEESSKCSALVTIGDFLREREGASLDDVPLMKRVMRMIPDIIMYEKERCRIDAFVEKMSNTPHPPSRTMHI